MTTRKSKPRPPAPRHQFVNLFFLSFSAERVLEWQGYIVEDLGHGYFLVQLCEWITGGPSNLHVVHLSAMAPWEFYLDHEDWLQAGERYSRIEAQRAEAAA